MYNDITEQQRFQDLKRKSLLISNFYAQIGQQKKQLNILNCGTILVFGKCPNDGYTHLVGANFCRERFCPVCAWRRQKRFYFDTVQILDRISKVQKYQFLFLTLTVRNCSAQDLRGTLQQMQGAFNKLLKRRKVDRLIKGYIKALEITYNSAENTYHPHYHVVLCVDKTEYFQAQNYITQKEFVQLWQFSLQECYAPSVNIKAVDRENATSSASELVKYTLKFSDLETYEVLGVLDKALHNKRCIAYGGICRETKRELHLQDVESASVDLTDGTRRECPKCGSVTELQVSKWSFGANKYIIENL